MHYNIRIEYNMHKAQNEENPLHTYVPVQAREGFTSSNVAKTSDTTRRRSVSHSGCGGDGLDSRNVGG